MNAIFDTNPIYYLESKLTDTELKKLQEKVINEELKVFISPISVIEMGSRLKKTSSDFKKVQTSIRNLITLNPVFLPDPELQLVEYVLNLTISENEYRHWKETFYTIKVAPNVTELELGFDDLSTHTRRAVNLEHLHIFRNNYESCYVTDMEIPLKTIIENYDKKIAKRKSTRITKERIADFKKYLTSNNWTNQIKLILINRTDLPLPIDDAEIEELFKKIYFFRKAYEALFLKIFEEGYVPNAKKKNDYNDLHFNVYFHDMNDFIFITSENNIVFQELERKGRRKDITDLLK